jgi:hypothetical protein
MMIPRFLVAAFCVLGPLTCAAQSGIMARLPTNNYISIQVPGSTNNIPLGINDSGDVTGWYTGGGSGGGFIRHRNGQYTTFNVPGSDVDTYPVSINARGDVTGYWTSSAGPVPPVQGFVRDRWGVFSAINVPGSTSVWPTQINASGTVVGFYSTATDYALPWQAFVRYPNGVVTTFNIPGSLNTVFNGINDAGEIIGVSESGTPYFKLSRKGVLTSLNAFPEGINREGDIVEARGQQQGFVQFPNGYVTAFTVPGAGWLADYIRINDLGYVMGAYSDQLNTPDVAVTSPPHGFIRSPDGVITSFDPPNSTSTMPTGLNNANEVIGYYEVNPNPLMSTPVLGFLRLPTCGKGGVTQRHSP